MRLVVLIDNCAINGRNLKGEGGASYYIEDEDKKFLLDTGASGLFMENAKNLDIDLDNEIITIAPVGDWQDED